MARSVSHQVSQLLQARAAARLMSIPLRHRQNTGLTLSTKSQPSKMSKSSSLPWEAVVPQPRCSKPASTTRHEVLRLLEDGQTPGIDFLLVDVRREDHQGSTIAGSLNIPIQTLAQSLPTLLRICVGAKIDRAIFYCGHSTGRGPRAAALFTDEIHKNKLDGQIHSAVLTEGFNGWSTEGEAFDKHTAH